CPHECLLPWLSHTPCLLHPLRRRPGVLFGLLAPQPLGRPSPQPLRRPSPPLLWRHASPPACMPFQQLPRLPFQLLVSPPPSRPQAVAAAVAICSTSARLRAITTAEAMACLAADEDAPLFMPKGTP